MVSRLQMLSDDWAKWFADLSNDKRREVYKSVLQRALELPGIQDAELRNFVSEYLRNNAIAADRLEDLVAVAQAIDHDYLRRSNSSEPRESWMSRFREARIGFSLSAATGRLKVSGLDEAIYELAVCFPNSIDELERQRNRENND